MLKNSSYTPIPLSPEETEAASLMLGRSLFSALQLAREEEARKALIMGKGNSAESSDVLKIPIPLSLLQEHQKVGEDLDTPQDSQAGKILGSYLGAMGGAGIAAAYRNPAIGMRHNIKTTLQGGLLGGLLGLGSGAYLDYKLNDLKQELEDKKRINLAIALAKRRQIENFINNPELYSDSEKLAAYSEDDSPGIFARAFRTTNQPLQVLSGAQEGFRQAKKEYYLQEKRRIAQELMQAQKEYIDTLNSIKKAEHSEEATPCVDAFCNGVAHMALFGKTAEDENDPPIEAGTLRRLLAEGVSVAKRPFQPAIDTAATGLLGTAAGSAYLTYLLRKKMREEPEEYLQEKLPTRVELEPY
jgi:hypothetical protein